MLQSEARGAEYHAKAEEASALAETSLLMQVRLKHEAAAAAWLGLAEFEDRRSSHAQKVAERTKAAAEQGSPAPPCPL
jgi:hypothetical protein